MKVTQEKLPASQLGLEIEVPSDMSQKAYDQAIAQFSRQASIPGFRKGKVPRQVLLQRLGASRVKAAALEDLIQDCVEKAIESEDIQALGNFQLLSSFEELISGYQPGEPLTFSVSVDVPPEVELQDYANLQVKAEEAKYDPAEVDNFLEERRKEQATLIPVEERPAQKGDVAIVDYEGKIVPEPGAEPEPLPGGEAQDFQIELEEGRFIEGFVEGVIGMNPGETKEISVNFPQDYPNEDLQGKEARFQVTLKEIKEKELPELDDDFAQAVSEFETLDELRSSIETQHKERAERETKANKEGAILKELVKVVEVDLPQTLVDREVDNMLQHSAMQLANYGIDVNKLYTKENLPALREQTKPEAMEKLKQSLALKKVSDRENIEVTDSDINARIEELKDQLPSDLDMQRLREAVRSELQKEKALAWLEEHATIELMSPGTLAAEEGETEAEASSDAIETTAVEPESQASE
jgi:trigger factor